MSFQIPPDGSKPGRYLVQTHLSVIADIMGVPVETIHVVYYVVFEGRPGVRGWIQDQIAMLRGKRIGMPAGDHYHKTKDKVLLVVVGSVRITLQMPNDAGTKTSMVLRAVSVFENVARVPRGSTLTVEALKRGTVLAVFSTP